MLEVKDLTTLDVADLFTKHDIEDIKKVNVNLERDIDKKREELRTLVGERYRDLMDAADTIIGMKTTCDNVGLCVERVITSAEVVASHSFLSAPLEKSSCCSDDRKKKEEENFEEFELALGAQLKLLMDAPELLWSAVERNDYLNASSVFLFARHIQTHLLLGDEGARITSDYPLVQRQWSAVAPFQEIILQGCEDHLRSIPEETTSVIESLGGLLLLKGADAKELFRHLLVMREEALREKLSSSEPESAKSYVQETLIAVILCVETIALAFSGGDDSPLASALNAVLMRPSVRLFSGILSTSPLMSYLPGVVRDFCPSIPVVSGKGDEMLLSPRKMAGSSPMLSTLDSSYVRHECTRWLDRIHDLIVAGTSRVLAHVTSISGLNHVKKGVYDFLLTSSVVKRWNDLGHLVLGRKVNLWEEFYRQLFRDRAEQLISHQLQESVAFLKGCLLQSFSNGNILERESSDFIWGPDQKATTASKMTTLELRARAFPPLVQKVCTEFDEMLCKLMQDLSDDSYAGGVLSDDEPFRMSQDMGVVLDFTQKMCQKTLCDMLEDLTLNRIEDVSSHQLLYMGRICQAVTELCPSLEACATSDKCVHEWRSSARSDHSKWNSIKTAFDNETNKLFLLWIKRLLEDKLRCNLKNNFEQNLKMFLKWDSIEISEDSDDGKTLTSVIRVPCQMSTCLHHALSTFFRAVYAVGPHSLPALVLGSISKQTVEAVEEEYADHVKKTPKMNQNVALQMHFDLQLMAQCVSVSSGLFVSSLSVLENHIDPFDMSVFLPYMVTRVKWALLRYQTLFSLLITPDRHALLISMKSALPPLMETDERNQLMAMSDCCHRFPLLPVSSNNHRVSRLSVKGTHASKLSNSSSFVSDFSNKFLTDSSSRKREKSPVSKAANSFFEAVSNTWFGGGKM